MNMKIEIQITAEDVKGKFKTIRERNMRLSLLINTTWVNDNFDLVIWMPDSPGDELNGYWAQGKREQAGK